MKVLVILGHQRQGSFCHAIADAAVEQLQTDGHEAIVTTSTGEIRPDSSRCGNRPATWKSTRSCSNIVMS